MSVVSVNHSQRRGAFEGRDAELLQMLMPHLQRAIVLHHRRVGSEVRAAGLAAALDRVSSAVFVLTSNGQVLLRNRAAEALLQANDGLRVKQGTLVGATSAETAALRGAVHASLALLRGDASSRSSACRISRPSMRAPLMVVASPAAPNTASIGGKTPAAFGLTNAEARISVSRQADLVRLLSGLEAAP